MLHGLRVFAILAVTSMLLAACGGDEDEPSQIEDETPGGSGTDATTPVDDTGTNPTPSDDDAMDIGEVPEPGLAVIEVDDQTFEGELTECHRQEDGGQVIEFRISAQADVEGQRVILGASGGRAAGSDWNATSAVMIDGDIVYSSQNVGRAAAAGQSFVYEGEYVWLDDEGEMESGDGRFAATCT